MTPSEDKPAPDAPRADAPKPEQAPAGADAAASARARGVWISDDRAVKVRFQPRTTDDTKAQNSGEAGSGGAGESDRVDWTFTLPLLGCMGFLGAGLCVFSSLAYAGLSTVTKQAPILTPLIFGGVIALLATLWMFWRERSRRRANLAAYHARLFVMRSLCGSCGYSLQGLNSAHDGCRVCPECGAAWRVLASPAADV